MYVDRTTFKRNGSLGYYITWSEMEKQNIKAKLGLFGWFLPFYYTILWQDDSKWRRSLCSFVCKRITLASPTSPLIEQQLSSHSDKIRI